MQRFIQRKFRYPSFHGADYGGYAECWVHPVIPRKGSLGVFWRPCPPLSHIALGLIGLGKVEYKGETVDAAEASERRRYYTGRVSGKRRPGLNNGTQMMTAVGVNVLWDAMRLLKVADIATAMTAEALHGITKAYDPKVQN